MEPVNEDGGREARASRHRARNEWAGLLALVLFVVALTLGVRAIAARSGPPDDVAATAAQDASGGGAGPLGAAVDPNAPAPEVVREVADLPPGQAERIDLVYFHRTNRCWSCTEAERLIGETLETMFADDVAAGRMGFLVADVEKAENAALAARYDAWSSSLYLEIVKDGRHYVVPATDIWFDINEPNRFIASLGRTIALARGDT